MKFAEWITFAKMHANADMPPIQFAKFCRESKRSEREIAMADMEADWVSARRPYYSVYPAMLSALMKVKLSIPWNSLIWPMDSCEPVLIRLPENDDDGVKSVLCCGRGGRWQISAIIKSKNAAHKYFGDEASSSYIIEDTVKTLEWDGQGPPIEFIADSFRLFVAVCLIGNNPDFVQPEVLSEDAARYEKTLDPKLVEKAKRRGKKGWTIGKSIESIPHLRRPHFGIRWTGKAKAIPKIVPIKGCVVRKGVVHEVPTGYLDDEAE